MKKTLFLIFAILTLSLSAEVHSNQSFSKSKKDMYMKVYKDHKETFYCQSKYEYRYNPVVKRRINWIYADPSIYTPRNTTTRKGKVNIRAQRTEAEHIFPAWNFGHQMSCWRDGDSKCVTKKGKSFKGRKCCTKVSKKYRIMQADLHNLVPAIGEINADRLNFRYMDTREDLKGNYGQCKFKVVDRKAYPANYTKGLISRTYLYMINSYDIKISKSELQLMNAWNKTYPVSSWEKNRNDRINRIQGNSNPFVK